MRISGKVLPLGASATQARATIRMKDAQSRTREARASIKIEICAPIFRNKNSLAHWFDASAKTTNLSNIPKTTGFRFYFQAVEFSHLLGLGFCLVLKNKWRFPK